MKDKYIRVYDNVINEEKCLHYISLIEKSERKPGSHVGDNGEPFIISDIKKSEDVCISSDYPLEVDFLMKTTSNIISQYEKDVETFIPIQQAETFVGRVYRKNEGYYRPHIDVAGPVTYGRMITMLFYLNSIEEGGELYFENQDITIKAKTGRVVCFPPFWQYKHAALPSLSSDRYILRTFIKGK